MFHTVHHPAGRREPFPGIVESALWTTGVTVIFLLTVIILFFGIFLLSIS